MISAAALGVLVGSAVLIWPGAGEGWTPTGRRRGTRRRASGPATADQVAEALDLLALALTGGGSVARAAAVVGATLPVPTGPELSQVATQLAEGGDPRSAWASAGEHWQPGRQSLELADLAGIAPGEALARSAIDLRRESIAAVEVAAARLGVVLVIPLGLAFLPAFVLTTIVPLVVALTRDLTW